MKVDDPDVARANGFDIPTLCHLGSAPTGACRICVVRSSGQRNWQRPARPITSGMVVRTDSERVLDARRFIVELLVSCHPLDCMTCEKMGNCTLQDLAYELKVDPSRMNGERYNHPIDISNPFIIRDYNKCILCLRCVRVCKELQGIEAIKTINRGFDTKIATAYDTPLQDSTSVFCGQCVQVCPVGALTERKATGLGRTYETQKIRTTCPYCGVGCQLNLHVKGEQIVRVTGVEDGLPEVVASVSRAASGYDFIYRERLTTPLIREQNGQFGRPPGRSA